MNWFDRIISATPEQAMFVFGALMFVMTVFFLGKAHYSKKGKIDLSYLLVDPAIKQVTLAKFGGFIGTMGATWLFVYLPVVGKYDTTYALGYLGILVAGKVATDWINKAPTPGG